jgi:hypothetical protein
VLDVCALQSVENEHQNRYWTCHFVALEGGICRDARRMKRKREKNCYLKTVCNGVRSCGRSKGHASDAAGTEDRLSL